MHTPKTNKTETQATIHTPKKNKTETQATVGTTQRYRQQKAQPRDTGNSRQKTNKTTNTT